MNTITLTMGDWSHDGHCKTRVVAIECNLTRDELEAAYDAGVVKTGVDLTEEVAAEYEDNSFPAECIEKLRKFGFQPDEFLYQDYRDPQEKSVWYDGFWSVWMFIAKVGNPDLVSRNQAKKLFTLKDHEEATRGIECRKDEDVIDETPMAYKSIDDVMKAQSDLVEVVAELRQVLCVKG